MEKYDQARKYLDTAFVETVNDGDRFWWYCYYGLLEYNVGNIEMANSYLMTFANLCDSMDLAMLERVKQHDPKNINFITRCQNLITSKSK